MTEYADLTGTQLATVAELMLSGMNDGKPLPGYKSQNGKKSPRFPHGHAYFIT